MRARKSWRVAPGEMWFVVPPGRRKVGAGPDTFPPAAGTPVDRDRAGTKGRLSDSEYGADPTNERRSLFRSSTLRVEWIVAFLTSGSVRRQTGLKEES